MPGKTLPLITPDGRYIVVRGRLWRRADPRLSVAERDALTRDLMDARRAIGRLKLSGLDATSARATVDRAKVALGERGPVWWDDGAPDENRRMARNSRYAEWFRSVEGAGQDPAEGGRFSPEQVQETPPPVRPRGLRGAAAGRLHSPAKA